MGPFEWLAGRWTPEFEYRDRLADEVEDIAYESTRTGTRRGFLIGVLLGAVLALIGLAALAGSGVQMPFLSTAGLQEGRQEPNAPQFSPEDLSILKQENEQLRKALAEAKAAAPSTREKQAAETKPPRRKTEAAEFPPPEKRVVETKPPEPRLEAPAARPPRTVAKEVTTKPEGKAKASPPGGAIAQPIPSNCRKEGDCDPVGQ